MIASEVKFGVEKLRYVVRHYAAQWLFVGVIGQHEVAFRHKSAACFGYSVVNPHIDTAGRQGTIITDSRNAR